MLSSLYKNLHINTEPIEADVVLVFDNGRGKSYRIIIAQFFNYRIIKIGSQKMNRSTTL